MGSSGTTTARPPEVIEASDDAVSSATRRLHSVRLRPSFTHYWRAAFTHSRPNSATGLSAHISRSARTTILTS